MADHEFTIDDLEALGAKLDGLTQLDERDRMLLLSVFELAAQQVAGGQDVSGFSTGPSGTRFLVPESVGLGEGFRNSFQTNEPVAGWTQAHSLNVSIRI
jgi:hypothetical protein